MSRRQSRGAIGEVFDRCRKERRAAFIPYLCAGDPDLATTPELLRALVRGGADIIELGVPFSDPAADGPTNQRAAHRALEAGTTVEGILQMIAKHREELGVPIVLFSYTNPLIRRGIDHFAERASASGVDGVLFVDLPPEESAAEISPALAEQGIDQIFLLAPTSTKARIKAAAKASSGFVYYVSRTGVTGATDELPDELIDELEAVRKRVKLPLAVGFGVSTPQQVAALGLSTDAVVVGSHLVQMVEDYADDPDLPGRLERRVRDLTDPLRAGSGG